MTFSVGYLFVLLCLSHSALGVDRVLTKLSSDASARPTFLDKSVVDILPNNKDSPKLKSKDEFTIHQVGDSVTVEQPRFQERQRQDESSRAVLHTRGIVTPIRETRTHRQRIKEEPTAPQQRHSHSHTDDTLDDTPQPQVMMTKSSHRPHTLDQVMRFQQPDQMNPDAYNPYIPSSQNPFPQFRERQYPMQQQQQQAQAGGHQFWRQPHIQPVHQLPGEVVAARRERALRRRHLDGRESRPLNPRFATDQNKLSAAEQAGVPPPPSALPPVAAPGMDLNDQAPQPMVAGRALPAPPPVPDFGRSPALNFGDTGNVLDEIDDGVLLETKAARSRRPAQTAPTTNTASSKPAAVPAPPSLLETKANVYSHAAVGSEQFHGHKQVGEADSVDFGDAGPFAGERSAPTPPGPPSSATSNGPDVDLPGIGERMPPRSQASHMPNMAAPDRFNFRGGRDVLPPLPQPRHYIPRAERERMQRAPAQEPRQHQPSSNPFDRSSHMAFRDPGQAAYGSAPSPYAPHDAPAAAAAPTRHSYRPGRRVITKGGRDPALPEPPPMDAAPVDTFYQPKKKKTFHGVPVNEYAALARDVFG